MLSIIIAVQSITGKVFLGTPTTHRDLSFSLMNEFITIIFVFVKLSFIFELYSVRWPEVYPSIYSPQSGQCMWE